jgi:hypothetical protein
VVASPGRLGRVLPVPTVMSPFFGMKLAAAIRLLVRTGRRRRRLRWALRGGR